MRLTRIITATLVSLAFVAVPVGTPVVAADDDAPGQQRQNSNVLVKITVGKLEGSAHKPLRTYHIPAPGSGAQARLNTSNRIPIPAVMMPPPKDEGSAAPVSSFSYQNVGFQANVRAWILGSDRVRVSADIEDAAFYNPADIDRKPGTTAPVITNFSQTIDAILHEGAPITTTVVDDPKGQSMYVQVGAEIQR